MANIAHRTSGDIVNVERAVIAHQCNCRCAIGAGVSGSICNKWPIVEKRFYEFCSPKTPEELFGLVQPITVSEDIIVCNVFTQLNYGNAAKTGKVYTDEDALVAAITRICERYTDRPIVVPEKIGCGLAGGNWASVEARLSELPINIVSFVPGGTPELKMFNR